MGKNLFIDAEWFLNQEVYLIGWAYNLQEYGQLYGDALTEQNFAALLQGVDAIYCFGPDVGMLEKFFDADMKTYYYCFNLLPIIRRLEPDLPSYKLCDLEIWAGIHRETMQYKSNIWKLHSDWMNPQRRALALKYNMEDVLNMIRVKNYFFQIYGIRRRHIEQYRM